MRPRPLRFIKYCNMLNFTKASLIHLNGLLRINFKNTIFHGILDLCQHNITIPMDHLDRFSNFTPGIR